jgi:beta-lactamase superfamily II metal-dependent hydrolase
MKNWVIFTRPVAAGCLFSGMIIAQLYGQNVLAATSDQAAETSQHINEPEPYYPSCADAQELGRYEPRSYEYGWIDTTSEPGFSCKINKSVPSHTDGYPICQSAVTDHKDNHLVNTDPKTGYGWIEGIGFNCQFRSEDERLQLADLKLVHLYVSHGDATLIFLPNDKLMLIDSGQHYFAEEYLIPFLQQQGISTIDYLVITHTDGDHIGGLTPLRQEVKSGNLTIHNTWINDASQPTDIPGLIAEADLGGVNAKVLSWYKDSIVHKTWCLDRPSECRNERSLSLYFDYYGFTYATGADIYREQQETILWEMPEYVDVDVYRTNHHLHGSVSREYLKATNPALFITSANKVVKERTAYTVDFAAVLKDLQQRPSQFKKSFLTEDDGHIAVWVNDQYNWGWKAYSDPESAHKESLKWIPQLHPTK